MPHPHHHDGCNDPFALSTHELGGDPALFRSVLEVQIVVKQPSPHWVKFGLVDVRCFSAAEDTALKTAEVRRLTAPPSLHVRPHSCPCPHSIEPRSDH